jgi:NADH dehydrogenase FAD-containing subunit
LNKRVAIVGGGYLGAELARELDGQLDVTLIERNSHFVHSIAMIRALVDPGVLDGALLPYDRLLARGKVIAAEATGIDATGVTLADGRKIEADYVVVATGSGNAPVFKPGTDGIAGLRAMHASVHARLRAANHVAIVGAGAVGTELAGEIAHALPKKKVTLISSDPTLFPSMPAKLGQRLLARLQQAGVGVVLGARAENLASLTEPSSGTLRLSTGQEIVADLIIPAVGSRANSTLLAPLPGAVGASMGRIKADAWMRPSTLPNLFAAGDSVDLGDPMTAIAIRNQKAWLKATLLALAKGASLESRKPYRPMTKGRIPILVPLGPKLGASNLVLFVAGDWLTGALKGRTLFLDRYRKLFRKG